MIVKVTANEIEVKVSSGNKSLCLDILNSDPISVEVQALIKGEKGDTGTSSNLWNVKRFDPNLPINPTNYQVITLDGNINSGNIQMPTNPVNGENYTFNYLTGPNSINVVFTPKSILQNGFNQLPITPNSPAFVFEVYFDSQYDLWRLKYSSNN